MTRQARCWFPRIICGASGRSRWQILALLSLAATLGTTSAIGSRANTGHLPGGPSEVSVHYSAGRAESDPGPLSKETVQTVTINPPPQLTQSLLLTITPRGFDLNSITVPALPFFLVVENRSGLSEMSLSLQLEGGPVIRAVHVQHEDLDWADLLVLAPGSYMISEASHPSQLCHLMVVPK